MANNKKIIDQLPKINVSNAGDYLSNLVNAYNTYRAGREERRDNFRQGVQKAADNIYQNLPENVQSGLNTAGNYLDKATGIGSMTEYLERMDDYMRNQIISPAANYADKIYGKIMENYQPESRMPNTEGISGITEPVQQKKSRSATSDYYTNVSNEINNQTIASQPKQKMMRAADVSVPVVTGEIEGGAGTEVVSSEGESKPITVDDYNVWSKLQEQKQSIVDAYDANVNYAEEMKNSAYQQAKDAYKVAAREAQGNYEANKPTYGLAAEQMYKSGLTGSGYSDYLAGKAMEARTGEINAARSQQAAAQIAAEQTYQQYLYDALNNKINSENAFAETEREYLAAYNTEINNAIANIMDGLWDASVAEAYLNRYAPGGAIDEETRAMIQQAMTNYNKSTYNSVTSALLEYLNAELKAGNPVSEESVRRWLVDNAPGITDTQINAYLSGYFKDGRLNTELVAGATQGSGTTTNPNNPGSSTDGQGGSGTTDKETTENTGSSGNTGNTGNTGSSGGNSGNNYTAGEVIAGAGMGIWDWFKNLFGGNKNNQGGTTQDGLEEEVATAKPNSYEETLDLFSSEVLKNHDAKDVDWYKKQLENLGSEAFDQDAAAKIKNMANGYVVSSGKFEGNTGLRTNFQNGDNFSVTIGGQSYRVESQGEASQNVKSAAAELSDGVVFGYGSELYIKSGDTAYKIGPRPGVGNGDYDRLWRAVYQEQIANIKAGTEAGITNNGANTETLSANEKLQMYRDASQARRAQEQAKRQENWDNFVKDLENDSNEAGDTTQNALSNIVKGMASIGNTVQKTEQQWSDDTRKAIETLANATEEEKQEALAYLQEQWDITKKNTSDNWNKIVNWSSKVNNAVQSTEQQWANDTQSAIDTLANATEAEKQEARDYLQEQWDITKQNAKDAWNKIVDFYNRVQIGNKAFGPNKEEWLDDYIDSLPKEIGRGVANYERDGMFDRNLKKGDNFTVEVAGKSYKVESKGEVNDEELIAAANDAGIHNGEVFTYGQGTYLKQGDKFYEVGQRPLATNQDEALRIAIKNNSGNVVTDDSYQSMSEYDVYLSGDPRRDFKTMDKIELSDGNGNSYKLQIRAVLGEDSAAYRAGNYVDNGEAYIHGNDIYVKYGENAYKLAAVGGNKNGDYDRMAEVLWQNNHYSDGGFGGFKGASVTTDAKTKIQGAGKHTNYKLDKDGNIKHNSIGEFINVYIGDTGYAVGSSGITTTGAYRAGQSNGAEVGEIYAWNGQLFMYLGDGALQLKPLEGTGGSALGYEDLLKYLEDMNKPNAN